MKGKTRQRVLLVLTIGLAMGFLGDRVLFTGLRSRGESLKRDIALEEVTLRTDVGIQQRKGAILTEQKRYEGYLLPPSQDRETIAEFLKETERIAQEAGVTIADLTPDNQPAKAPGYKVYKVQLKAEAGVEQLLNLLYKFQSSKRLIKLDRFSLTPKDESAKVVRLEATVVMLVP